MNAALRKLSHGSFGLRQVIEATAKLLYIRCLASQWTIKMGYFQSIMGLFGL